MIFKAYKIFFITFFSIYKNDKELSKTQRKGPKRSMQKISKPFRGIKKGRKNAQKRKKLQHHRESNKNLSEEQKQKLAECMMNYYLAHKK